MRCCEETCLLGYLTKYFDNTEKDFSCFPCHEGLKISKPLLADELWEIINPSLPLEKTGPKGGRPRVQERLALTGILFLARTGTACELVPLELGCGSGVTCWRRLWDWQVSGMPQKVWKAIFDKLGLADVVFCPT